MYAKRALARRVPALLPLVALAGALALGAEAPSWRVDSAEVRVLCPMTVGGSFEAKTKSLGGTVALASARPAAFRGELTVELRSLDTGISLRNEHMLEKYLEVGKGAGYEKAVLSEIRLPDADAGSFQGQTTFTGTFALHGTSRPVSGRAQIRREGERVHVEASFPVQLAAYGIPKPQFMGVGVKDEVEVKASLQAVPASPSTGGAQ